MLFDGQFSDTILWKEDEARVSRFVFIGKNLDRTVLQEGFENCRVTEELRFGVGDSVEVNVGEDDDEDEWATGTVVALWEEGNAYRVRLDDKVKNDDNEEEPAGASASDGDHAKENDDDDEEEEEESNEVWAALDNECTVRRRRQTPPEQTAPVVPQAKRQKT